MAAEGIVWSVGFPLDDVLEELAFFGRDYSDVVDIGMTPVPDRSVALILEDGAVTHVAVAERGPYVATRKRRLSFRRVEPIRPIALDDILRRMPSRTRNILDGVIGKGDVRIPAATWAGCVKAIEELDAEVGALIATLTPRPSLAQSRVRTTLWEERDAVMLGMELAEVSRPWLSLPRRRASHFLEALSESEVSEDRLIEHDAHRFPGWVPTVERPGVARTFADASGRAVTIINVNRGPIERTTGVDLVYYREDTDSFVMVQYKRLRNEPPNWVFRPSSDKNWRIELSRMEAVTEALGRPDRATPRDYHLERTPFFVKLCRPVAIDLTTRDLASGLYFSLDYWKVLQAAPESRGPRGGVAIGYHNAQKWLTTTLFVDLIKRDWLGSSEGASKVLHSLLAASVARGRSAVIAIGQPRQPGAAPVGAASDDWLDDGPF